MAKELAVSSTAVVESPKPAADMLLRVQDSMRGFLPAVYELGEFDWWQVRSDKRAVLGDRTRSGSPKSTTSLNDPRSGF